MAEEELQRLSLGQTGPPLARFIFADNAERDNWWTAANTAMGALLSAASSPDGRVIRAIEPAAAARYAFEYADAMVAEARRRG